MDISSALDWWDEWKLRVLVLGSTVIQLFLFVYGAARRAPTPPWFGLCIWLAYLTGDSLAIYALATLFNRHGREAPARSTLEVLWAPVLLIHLAGQEQITAYSVQDNELWRRHDVPLVSQVAVALFVFCKSWSGERRLLVAAILMFAIGIYKFSIKPWALKRASFRELVRSPVSVARRKKLIGFSGRWADCWRDWTETIKWPSMVSALPLLVGSHSLESIGERVESIGELVEAWTEGREEQLEEEGREEELKIQEYVEKAKDIMLEHIIEGILEDLMGGQSAEAPLFLAEAQAFAADLLVPYSRRLSMLRFMLNIPKKMSIAIWVGLLEVYACLYTRVKVTLTPVGIFLRLLTFSLAVAAIVLFARSHKPHQDGSAADIKVTYILFCCVALLELLSFANLCILLGPAVIWPASFKHDDMVAQQSLMSCAARRRKPTQLLRLAALLGCDGYLNKHWYITHTPSLEPIRDAVHAHALKGWLEYILDAATYRSFNDMRGEWAVGKRSSKHPLDPATRNHCLVLLNSFKAPFDESVLLWHIATEICFHHTSHCCGALVSLIPHGNADAAAQSSSKRMMNAHVISCYMMSLLLVRPEMLMLGTRQHLFSVALDDIEYIALRGEVNKNHDLGCGILRSVLHVPWVYGDCVGPLIPKACKLAMPLLQLLQLQEADTWEMLEGVWVEMLCYAAGRCRGYLHAERLGEGCSELLTQIWLLLCYLGMETLADRLQRRLPEGN